MTTPLDTTLKHTLKDIHAFSCISNLAYQSTKKLSPELYNQMTISIMYRLLHLTFEDTLQEAIRLSLLVFSCSVFMQRKVVEQRYELLLDSFDISLRLVMHCRELLLPLKLRFWMLMMHAVTLPPRPQWREDSLTDVLQRLHIRDPRSAKDVLRSVGWIDFVHGRAGEMVIQELQAQVDP